MILPDVNVLIGAYKTDAPKHEICKEILKTEVARGKFGISPLTLAAAIRVLTNAKTYFPPEPFDGLFGFCGALLNHTNCVIVEPGERHWTIFQRLCIDTNTRGSMTTDAWYAALAIEWGCEWITLDKDFARFPGLSWRMPAVSA